jgi:DNA end-binding protein Ku
MRRVDEETGEEVPYEQIISGYEVGKGQYLEITDEELEAIALESTRTIDIDEFVPKTRLTTYTTSARITSPRKAR